VSELAKSCTDLTELAGPGEQLEAYGEHVRRLELLVRDENLSGIANTDSHGLGVRLLAAKAGHAYGFSTTRDTRRLEQLVTQVRANTDQSTASRWSFPRDDLPCEISPWMVLGAPVEPSAQMQLAIDLERVARSTDDRICSVAEARVGCATTKVALASTQLSAREYERVDLWCAVSAIAQDRGGTASGFAFRHAHYLDGLDVEKCARQAASSAVEALGARPPTVGHVPAVFSPFAAVEVLEIIAEALDAEQMAEASSVLAGRRGSAIASRNVTIVDDPRGPDALLARPFDDEGVPTSRRVLIEEGVLRSALHNVTSAREGGDEPGNASRAG
jgi:PmbA protein